MKRIASSTISAVDLARKCGSPAAHVQAPPALIVATRSKP